MVEMKNATLDEGKPPGMHGNRDTEECAGLLQKPNRTWPVEQIFWKEDCLPQLPKVLSESWEGNETRAYMRILRTMSGDWQEHKESG